MENEIKINEQLNNLLNRRDFLTEMRQNPDLFRCFLEDSDDDIPDIKEGKKIFNLSEKVLGFDDFVKEKSK